MQSEPLVAALSRFVPTQGIVFLVLTIFAKSMGRWQVLRLDCCRRCPYQLSLRQWRHCPSGHSSPESQSYRTSSVGQQVHRQRHNGHWQPSLQYNASALTVLPSCSHDTSRKEVIWVILVLDQGPIAVFALCLLTILNVSLSRKYVFPRVATSESALPYRAVLVGSMHRMLNSRALARVAS